MSLPDDQWQAELHRRMAEMYRLQSQLQQSNTELGQQVSYVPYDISGFLLN